MFRHYYYGPGIGAPVGAGGFVFPLLSLLFWVLVIWLIFRLLSRHGHHLDHYHSHHDHQVATDPIDAAKLRYAKGEITKTELEEIKKNLAE